MVSNKIISFLVITISLSVFSYPAFAEPDLKKFCGPEFPIHKPTLDKNYDIDDCEVVGTWSNMDKTTHIATVLKNPSSSNFETVPLKSIKGGELLVNKLDKYLERNPITSFVVMKEGKIFYERYQYGRKALDRMLGHSMTKSVIGLVGLAALSDGSISSINADVNSLTDNFRNTAYGKSKLIDLYTMTSGVDFPIGPKLWSTPLGDTIDAAYYFGYKKGGPELFSNIKNMRTQPGKEFAYSNGDVLVFSEAIQSAVKKPLGDYFSSAIWQNIGAENDAYFLTDPDGRVCAYGGFNATARDWGRLGLLIANKGRLNGRQIIKEDLMIQAVSGSKAKKDYGYFLWLDPDGGNAFMLKGFGGQFVIGSQKSGVVIVQTAVFVNGRQPNEKIIWSIYSEAQKLLASQ